jgi:5-hydroxyisourate hydrolase
VNTEQQLSAFSSTTSAALVTLTFRVTDKAGHYHVPVVVSPYGYSTYRGN